jgi:endonuclease/exonuclease/phosphatase family metal-dependent hydrolase
MKLMTLNIWNYHPPWSRRRSLIAGLVSHHEPDVVALQESRHDWRHERGVGQAEQLASDTGYHVISAVAQVFLPLLRIDEGLAFLTRKPVSAVSQLVLGRDPRDRQDENQRVCLKATLTDGSEILDIYNAHFSLSAPARARNAREVAAFVTRESGVGPAVLMGDLNASPEDEPIQYLTGEAGYIDCSAARHPDSAGYTDPSWAPRERIDYVLTRNVTWPVSDAQLLGTDADAGVYHSDHLGILVELAAKLYS